MSKVIFQSFSGFPLLCPQGIRLTVKEFDSLFTYYDKVTGCVRVLIVIIVHAAKL